MPLDTQALWAFRYMAVSHIFKMLWLKSFMLCLGLLQNLMTALVQFVKPFHSFKLK